MQQGRQPPVLCEGTVRPLLRRRQWQRVGQGTDGGALRGKLLWRQQRAWWLKDWRWQLWRGWRQLAG